MKKFSTRYRKHKFPLLALLFIAISIPLTVYGMFSITNMDTRNRAAEEELVSNACIISFPYVNPNSVEVGKTVQVQVNGNVPGQTISKVNVMERNGETLFEKEFTEGSDTISEIFTFSPKQTGDYGMLGTIVTFSGETKPCVLESNRNVTAVSENLAPEFQSSSSDANPSNAINVGESYEYLLQVIDHENDTINWAFSFTPDSDWLKYKVVEDGGEGKLTIKFSGIPDKPASYLANIFVHDGYNQHLRAQSWVISVDQDKNDIPKVSIYNPEQPKSLIQGDTVKVSWEGSDLNQIIKYELYITANPGNQSSWIPINTALSNNVGSYIFNTSLTEPGIYSFVVKAYDNGTPNETGFAVSPSITVSAKEVPTQDDEKEEEIPDDGIVLLDPQIINLSPSSSSKLKNRYAVISATLIAGTEAKITAKSLKIVVDDTDVTRNIKINEISDSEITIVYSTDIPYDTGSHKVKISFEDSKGNKANKEWTFSIEEETEEQEVYKLFGFEIPKRTAWIVGGGLGMLLLALIVPWLLYLAWKGSKDDDYESIYQNTAPIQPMPQSETIKPDRDSSPQETPKEKTGEIFTAPSPVNRNTPETITTNTHPPFTS